MIVCCFAFHRKVKPQGMALVTLIENAGRKFDAGDFTDAAALYKDALELNPNCLEALIGLGIQFSSMLLSNSRWPL